MKNLRFSLCVVALASFLAILTPSFAHSQEMPPIHRDSIPRTVIFNGK